MDNKFIFVSVEHAELCCKEWQKVLRLQDWDVRVTIVRGRELKSVAQANVDWVDENRTALIKLCDPIDFSNPFWEQDHEVSLVHELLHLHFAPFVAKDDTPQDVAQEQAIVAISQALVALKRNGEKPKESEEK